ncbi:hypothetical protein JOL79_11885 [Microbispora sp. RL4-1S]|uniref:Uncharacterized protein n=1 Tax=Microbispora oryzae TaxID=2806554 RepID=A0A940WPH6_9ACTN|nr:hypothetical protein [Microbispora oryzae]MBP2704514.1 hypothetical protein [Microbispora oryzae]
MRTGGARTRLSTFAAGVFLMVLCIVFGQWVSKIPMAALDAVENKYATRGKKVTVVGLNKPSAKLHKTLAGQLTGGH